MRRFELALLLGLLLALSLSLKATGGFKEEALTAGQDVPTFLAGLGFAPTGRSNGPWTEAQQDRCTIEVTQVSAQGWERVATAEYAGARTLRYFYGGEAYAEQPVLVTTVGLYLSRLGGYLHLPVAPRPVWAVVEGSNCPALVPGAPGSG